MAEIIRVVTKENLDPESFIFDESSHQIKVKYPTIDTRAGITNLNFNIETKKVTWTDKNNTQQEYDLTPFLTDIKVSGATIDSGVLKIQQEGGETVTLDLNQYMTTQVSETNSVRMTGDGSETNPLKAEIKLNPEHLIQGESGIELNKETLREIAREQTVEQVKQLNDSVNVVRLMDAFSTPIAVGENEESRAAMLEGRDTTYFNNLYAIPTVTSDLTPEYLYTHGLSSSYNGPVTNPGYRIAPEIPIVEGNTIGDVKAFVFTNGNKVNKTYTAKLVLLDKVANKEYVVASKGFTSKECKFPVVNDDDVNVVTFTSTEVTDSDKFNILKRTDTRLFDGKYSLRVDIYEGDTKVDFNFNQDFDYVPTNGESATASTPRQYFDYRGVTEVPVYAFDTVVRAHAGREMNDVVSNPSVARYTVTASVRYELANSTPLYNALSPYDSGTCSFSWSVVKRDGTTENINFESHPLFELVEPASRHSGVWKCTIGYKKGVEEQIYTQDYSRLSCKVESTDATNHPARVEFDLMLNEEISAQGENSTESSATADRTTMSYATFNWIPDILNIGPMSKSKHVSASYIGYCGNGQWGNVTSDILPPITFKLMGRDPENPNAAWTEVSKKENIASARLVDHSRYHETGTVARLYGVYEVEFDDITLGDNYDGWLFKVVADLTNLPNPNRYWAQDGQKTRIEKREVSSNNFSYIHWPAYYNEFDDVWFARQETNPNTVTWVNNLPNT